MSNRLDANNGVNGHAPKVFYRPTCRSGEVAQRWRQVVGDTPAVRIDHAPEIHHGHARRLGKGAQPHFTNRPGVRIAVKMIAKHASTPLLVLAEDPLFRKIYGHVLQIHLSSLGVDATLEDLAIQSEFAVSDWDHDLGRVHPDPRVDVNVGNGSTTLAWHHRCKEQYHRECGGHAR